MPRPPQPVMWADPGGMTGLAVWNGHACIADEYPIERTWDVLSKTCLAWSGQLYIGWERFTIGPDTHKLSPQPEAYELPGVLKYLAHTYKCKLLKPALPGERLAATPKMLQTVGWWTPGKDDAQSACQHMLSWMMRNNCVPDRERALLAGM